jgi:hypothetical protein
LVLPYWWMSICSICLKLHSLHPPVTALLLCHATFVRNVLKDSWATFYRVIKCCISYILFRFPTLNKGLNLLLVQSKWLGWKNNKAELLTTDMGWQNGAEFGQSCGFTLSMVIKQLGSTWIQVKTYLKCAWYNYVWADVHIWTDFNEIDDKQRSKVENLAKYVHLQEVQ